MFKPSKSVDDLSLPYPIHDVRPERRARSSSPVKNRRSLPAGFLDMNLPSLPVANHGDLSSLSGSSTPPNLTSDQLRALSNSPISKKLHITSNATSNKYCIPIPFTLQLPPKLSPKNQPVQTPPRTYKSSPNSSPLSKKSTASPRQVRLVYTGSGYEKIDTDSEDDAFGVNGSPRSRPPPLVKDNQTKASKLMFKTNLMSQDELSIIEEVSNCGSSRNSSVKLAKTEKTLPPKPGSLKRSPTRKPPPTLVEPVESVPPYVQKKPVSQQTVESIPPYVNQRGPADINQRSVQSRPEILKPVPTPASNRHSIASFPVQTAPYPVQAAPYPAKEIGNSKETSIKGTLIPKGYYEDHTKNNHTSVPINDGRNVLKIHKRTFSDESQVSSVSSFSSVGDFMNLCNNPSVRSTRHDINTMTRGSVQEQRMRAAQPALRAPQQTTHNVAVFGNLKTLHQPLALAHSQKAHVARIASNASDASSSSTLSGSSQSSWNSLQKSVDISLEESIHSPHTEEFVFIKEKSAPGDLVGETSPLRLSRSKTLSRTSNTSRKSRSPRKSSGESCSTTSSASEVVEKAVVINKSSVEQKHVPAAIIQTSKPEDSDNEGAGKRFSFPNSEDNITNAEDIKRAVRNSNSFKSHKSRFSHISANGQIEIPDLSDKSVAGSYTTGVSTCSYNGTTFDDLPSEAETSESSVSNSTNGNKLEPIGVPTRASKQLLKDQFRLMHNDDDSDTDIESNFYSASVGSKSTPNLSLNQFTYDNKATDNQIKKAPAPPTSSPVRHRRNKSMFNFNFNHENFEVITPASHNKSKSIDAVQLLNNPAPKKIEASSPEKLNIVVAEPPKKVDYAVDFKESAFTDESARIPSSTPTVHEIYNVSIDQPGNVAPKEAYLQVNRKVIHSINNSEMYTPGVKDTISQHKQISPKRKSRSGTTLSRTRNVSSKSARLTASDARLTASDASSVIIDLTEDEYDKYTILRNNSVLSYRSVTEKTKEGKEVEVVLVDEDDSNKMRDDLSSIYSKYQTSWGVSRSDSTASHSSTRSYESGTSYNSGASFKALQVKQRPATVEIYKQMQALRGPVNMPRKMNGHSITSNGSSNSSANSASYNSKRILMPSAIKTPNPKTANLSSSKSQPNLLSLNKSPYPNTRESNYFDYSNGDNYDFNSFMKQRTVSKPN